MKGPRGRWKFDVERVWECPHCRRRAFTSGRVVHLACTCAPSADERPAWMTLIEEMREMKKPAGARPPATAEEAAPIAETHTVEGS